VLKFEKKFSLFCANFVEKKLGLSKMD
jgi:arsenite-transporting ATPase